MTNFTAIYAAPISDKMSYSFKAENIKSAKVYCKFKFAAKEITLVNEDTNEVHQIINE